MNKLYTYNTKIILSKCGKLHKNHQPPQLQQPSHLLQLAVNKCLIRKYDFQWPLPIIHNILGCMIKYTKVRRNVTTL